MVALSCAVKKWNVCIPGQHVSALVRRFHRQQQLVQQAGSAQQVSNVRLLARGRGLVRWAFGSFKYFYKSKLVILVGFDSVHFVPSTLTHQFLRFDEIQIL